MFTFSIARALAPGFFAALFTFSLHAEEARDAQALKNDVKKSAEAEKKTPPPAPVRTDAAKTDPKKSKKKDLEEPEEIVVVSASKVPTSREKSGVSLDVIGKETLELNQNNHLLEDLRMVAGVSGGQTGKRGDISTLFIRGGNTIHTQVMYDGFKVTPSGQGIPFSFESLDPIGAERVEIAKGPGSVLFGTEAVTGAVNLITAKGEGRPLLTTSTAFGTYGQDREALSISGSEGRFAYNVTQSRFHRSDAGVRNSDLDQLNYAGRFDFNIAKDHDLKFLYRGVQFEKGWYENTASGMGIALDAADPNDKIRNDDILGGMEYRGKFFPIWETIIRAGYYELERRNYQESPGGTRRPDAFGTGSLFNYIQTRSDRFTRYWRPSAEWTNNITTFENKNIKNITTLGGYFEYERFDQFNKSFADTVWPRPARTRSTQGRDTQAGYVQNRTELYDRAFLTLGWRHDKNDDFDHFDSLRADLSVLIPETKTRVFGSIGNAYRAPSFFELSGGGFPEFGAPLPVGNPNLLPEKNSAFDFGVQQKFWKDKFDITGTFFKNRFNDLITFAPRPDGDTRGFGLYQNITKARTKGVEVNFAFRPIKQVSVESAHTWLQTEDNAGLRLIRRPPVTHTARLVLHPLIDFAPKNLDGLDISFETLNVSTRTDQNFDTFDFPYTGPRPRNPGYTRFDLAVSYRFLKHFRAFAKVENLTDEKYQESFSYPADGETVMGGLEFSWRF